MTDPVATTLIITLGTVSTTLLGLVFRRLDTVAKTVDGNNTEQLRQIAALTAEVGRLHGDSAAMTPDTTVPSSAPVSITEGQAVVTQRTEPKP